MNKYISKNTGVIVNRTFKDQIWEPWVIKIRHVYNGLGLTQAQSDSNEWMDK